MPDCYKVGPRKSEWFAPFLVNRLFRSLPWCFFNPSLALSTAAPWRNKYCVAWGHQWPQRRLRPRRAAAVRWNQFMQDRYIGCRLRYRHTWCAGARRRVQASGMAIGELGGCLGPWHRISHECPARHSLRRQLLSAASTSSRCSARRGQAGTGLRDNDVQACEHRRRLVLKSCAQ